MKKFLLFVTAIIVVVVLIVLIRTFTTQSKQVTAKALPAISVNDSAVQHLQSALRIPTVSNDAATTDSTAFHQFHAFLTTTFPLLHSKATVEKINGYSLLFTIKGSNPASKPIVLMAHQDVVPVEESARKLWRADPFSGAVIGDTLYGRGAVDDKGSLVAILEATEQLLREGFQPRCDVYIALGHDEEATGKAGAVNIAALLKQRNITPAFVLDEGGEVTAHEIPGVTKPVALVGIAEKGYVTVDLSINIAGSHSSMPAKETAIDQLAKAVSRLKENPFEATLNPSINAFMDYMGPEMSFVQRMAFSNRWLMSSLIKNTYSKRPGPDAMIRTTSAPTLFNAGVKENVIPTIASATINFRTLPGTTVNDVVQHIKQVIKDDRINITPRAGSSQPSAIADVNDSSFTYLQKIIRGWRTDVVVTPYLVLGATDGRYFTSLTPQVFRFVPFTDIKGFHGVNERIGISEYKEAIRFYYHLIKNY